MVAADPDRSDPPPQAPARPWWLAAVVGAVVGLVGGLIGPGGAEFRLPLLIGLFGFAALHAVPQQGHERGRGPHGLAARLLSGQAADVLTGWPVIVNLLVLIAVVLLGSHLSAVPTLSLPPLLAVPPGVVAGFGTGIVAALLGGAGGELLIPTITLLYGVDIRLAGTLSLAVSLPTMLVAFARYSRDDSIVVLRRHTALAVVMAAGSVVGSVLGAVRVGVVPEGVLVPLLATLLVASAAKVWRHR